MKKVGKFLALILVLTLVFSLTTSTVFAENGELPLNPDDDADERDFWLYYEVNKPGSMEALQEVVSQPAEPADVELDEPLDIAVIYPSYDVSDIWLRSFMAFEARMEGLGIPYNATEFASEMEQHGLQTTYTDAVIEEGYDYVIFGPTELDLQRTNIKRLMDAGIEVIIWNNETVIQDWGDDQPLGYDGYAQLEGAYALGEHALERLGTEGKYALARGTPGLIDRLRSGGIQEYLDENSDWEMVYEHYTEFMREGGYEAGIAALTAYPDVAWIHPANTASSMGVLSALQEQGKADDVFLTGWGGTGDELEAIRGGLMNATPMRMNDDMGAATAERIRYQLEGREDELPLVFSMEIIIAHDGMSDEEIAEWEEQAFRYSGVGTIER